MSVASGRHAREIQGVDSAGRCAYEFSQRTRVPTTVQYGRSKLRGHSPPNISPTPDYDTLSADADEDNGMKVILTAAGDDIAIGNMMLIRWFAGGPFLPYVIGVDPLEYTYPASADGVEQTITTTLGQVSKTDTFTPADA